MRPRPADVSTARSPVATGLAPSRSSRTGDGPGPPRLELHLGRLLTAGRRLEERLRLETPERGHHAGGEQVDLRVVVADGLVEAHAFHRDPVFRPFELALEGQEVLV